MSSDDPIRREPSDHTTMREVIDGFVAAGHVGDLYAEPAATVRCGTCQAVSAASLLVAVSIRRLEGASDPADMAVVVAAACPVCGTPGTLVLSFGPMADPESLAVMAALTDRRGDDEALPAGATPSEMPSPPDDQY